MAELKFQIGDKVFINGTYYQSANGTLVGGTANKKILEIDRIAANAAHPYHVKGISGWFMEDALKKYEVPPFNVGDEVKVINPITYGNKPFKTWYNTYDVLAMDFDRITIGKKGTIAAVVNAKNLQKVK